MQKQKNTIKLGYWAIRGRAQISRLLLAYTDTEWQDVKYTDANQWFHGDKKHLGLEFPNLPYLIEGDFKLTESSAIEKYIIERSSCQQLLGKTVQDKARVSMLLGVLTDIRQAYGSLIMDTLGYKERMEKVWQQIKPKLEHFEAYLKDKKDFALGYLTLVDFVIAQVSYYIASLYPEHYKNLTFLQRTREMFNNLPQIKQYYSQHRAIKWPFVTPSMAAIQVKNPDYEQ